MEVKKRENKNKQTNKQKERMIDFPARAVTLELGSHFTSFCSLLTC